MVDQLRHGQAQEAARVLSNLEELNPENLRAALVNALERIATMEQQWEELGQIYRWFNEQMEVRRASSSTEDSA